MPYKNSYPVYENNMNHVQYELFTGDTHGLNYLVDNARYQKIIKEFIFSYLR